MCEVTTLRDEDAVILATGFMNFGTEQGEERDPRILEGVADLLYFNEDNILHIERDYRLLPKDSAYDLPLLYLNSLCESSHGYGDAGSFNLFSPRAFEICRSIRTALEKQTSSRKTASVRGSNLVTEDKLLS